jgi:hypothetical protein
MTLRYAALAAISAAVLLSAAPAKAGSAHATMTVSATVVDACEASLDGSQAGPHSPATVSGSCTSGASAVAGVGSNGAVATRGKGGLMRTTTETVRGYAGHEGSTMFVTMSF